MSAIYKEGIKYAGLPDVSVSQTLTAGTEIASISVNGTPTSIYSPAYSRQSNNGSGYNCAASVDTLTQGPGVYLQPGMYILHG